MENTVRGVFDGKIDDTISSFYSVISANADSHNADGRFRDGIGV